MERKTKNAFTLIELLAVIVILAVIALIATPIILGIVEDAKKDAFLRSVELLVSTTDIDIANKTFEEEYTYTITDGNISNLEVSVKNTDGMNGSITYDMNGKEVYVIHNGVYCVKKTPEMSKAEISDYVEGECTLSGGNSGVFATITSKVPNENDVETYTNGQLINLGEYGIRYQGSDPDNYIYFNCEDYSNQTSETCETWRIIGIVDGKVKIIRNESIGSKEWNDAAGGVYTNNWNDSSLKKYLNGENEGDYYANLTDATRNSNFISPSTWYLRGIEDYADIFLTKSEMYDIERTTGNVYKSNPTYIENTKIGLMYPSDWGYAAMETESCLATKTLWRYELCKESNWMNLSHDSDSNEYFLWTITTNTGFKNLAFVAYPLSGGIYGYSDLGDNLINNPNVVLPTLYLSSDIEITGEGTSEQPFKLIP